MDRDAAGDGFGSAPLTPRIPVSACLVVKDDPFLPKAIASIRPFVDEICIVDSSIMPARAAEAKALADKYEREDEGIRDWSVLRDRSFALATHDGVIWLDSDDEVTGLEHLQDAILSNQDTPGAVRFICPYEYDYDADTGLCTRLQQRERIVLGKRYFRWERPAHENLVGVAGVRPTDVREPRIVWKHRRAHGTASGRALTILEASPDQGQRSLLDIGFELAAKGENDAAIEKLTAYLGGPTNNYDACRACLRLAELTGEVTDLSTSIEWARKAIDHEPRSFAARFKYASLMVAAGMMSGLDGSIRIGARESRAARDLPTDPSLVPWSPKERAHDVHDLIAQAYAWLGDDDMRDEAIDAWLSAAPTSPTALLADHTRRTTLFVSDIGKRTVAIACPATPDSWNPAKAARIGVGGSETAVIEMAKRLVKMGHAVTVYSNVGTEGLYDGVQYMHGQRLPTAAPVDVLVAWRDARMLVTVEAKTKLLWVHDLGIGGFSYEAALHADRILAVSKWHAEHLCKTYKLAYGHVVATRNGIDLSRFDRTGVDRDPRKAIYSSSPDRGLALLLDMWPEIAALVPGASLDVFYGFEGWDESNAARKDNQGAYQVASLKRRLASMPGVTYHGKVDQQTLAGAMLGAGAWLYPTHFFDETSCISAMEAQAAGLSVVATHRGALPETSGVSSDLVPGDGLSDAYRQRFVKSAVHALSRINCDERHETQDYARQFSWDGVASEWSALFESLLTDAALVLIPAFSTAMAA